MLHSFKMEEVIDNTRIARRDTRERVQRAARTRQALVVFSTQYRMFLIY